MFDKKLVLEKFPDAYAKHYPPTFQMGQRAPTSAGGYAVWRGIPQLGMQPIGEGVTEKAAWADAASRLTQE